MVCTCKKDGTMGLCINYRALNQKKKKKLLGSNEMPYMSKPLSKAIMKRSEPEKKIIRVSHC